MITCAQIDTNNICTSISELAGEVCPVNTIQIQSFDATVLGKEYKNGEFVTVPVVSLPPTERYISGLDYLRRFTQGQRIAIRELAKTDPIVADLMHLLDATIQQNGQVNLMDSNTVQGVGYLAAMLPGAAIDPAVILA